MHKLRIEGATLDPKEISDVLGFLDRAADARSILQSVTERFPRLGQRSQSIGEFRALLNDLAGKIAPDGTVPDHASVALGRLRRDIERQKNAIQESLERFLRSHHEEGVLQEEFVTIRNERFVVPVIAGQRRKIDGVIHGASSSGHTLFVEPLETIDLNNELVRLTEEELREVHRILRELTERLRGYADSILSTLVTMGALELDLRQSEVRHRIRLRDAPFQPGECAASGTQRRAASPVSKMSCGAVSNEWCRSAWSSTPHASRY